ncbi:serine protease inhibitor 5 precursor [Danaus plexippus plexippus]|uniref:Serine protease inhibitor 5 n=1 Tax=Danaus plexippus plexippus TaxID=278856 RepID=A0A212F898_DANPL|nr:serine protease inhibitor 5 precursor [Danaus plexippus plexippus]
MKCEIFLTVFTLVVYTKSDFSDSVGHSNIKLFENVASETEENFVISPLSVWSLMTTLSFEAGGKSRTQIKKAFFLPKESRLVKNEYINLTNTVQEASEGVWSSAFNESDTTVEPFYDEYGKEIGKVNMMNQKYPFPYSNMYEMSSMVLEMPYGNDQKYCMLILLPHPSVTVREVYESFQNVSFRDIFIKLKSDEEEFDLTEVDVKIPRFKIDTNVVINKALNSMGVYDIFEPGLANFKRMTDEQVYISSIIHKADIEVTESGTVASASSTSIFENRIVTPIFTANKPFIFLIMEKPTATVLFSGIYSKPIQF